MNVIIISTKKEWLMCIDFRQLKVLEVHGECLRFINKLRNTVNHFVILQIFEAFETLLFDIRFQIVILKSVSRNDELLQSHKRGNFYHFNGR